MLGFRDVWAFVGQKGITGFTPLEEVESVLFIKVFNKDITATATHCTIHCALMHTLYIFCAVNNYYTAPYYSVPDILPSKQFLWDRPGSLADPAQVKSV